MAGDTASGWRLSMHSAARCCSQLGCTDAESKAGMKLSAKPDPKPANKQFQRTPLMMGSMMAGMSIRMDSVAITSTQK